MPPPPCARCQLKTSGPKNFSLTCRTCSTTWHHRCHEPPVTDEELYARVIATTEGRPDEGLIQWRCFRCLNAPVIVLDDDGDIRVDDPRPLPPSPAPKPVPRTKTKSSTGIKSVGRVGRSDGNELSQHAASASTSRSQTVDLTISSDEDIAVIYTTTPQQGPLRSERGAVELSGGATAGKIEGVSPQGVGIIGNMPALSGLAPPEKLGEGYDLAPRWMNERHGGADGWERLAQKRRRGGRVGYQAGRVNEDLMAHFSAEMWYRERR